MNRNAIAHVVVLFVSLSYTAILATKVAEIKESVRRLSAIEAPVPEPPKPPEPEYIYLRHAHVIGDKVYIEWGSDSTGCVVSMDSALHIPGTPGYEMTAALLKRYEFINKHEVRQDDGR